VADGGSGQPIVLAAFQAAAATTPAATTTTAATTTAAAATTTPVSLCVGILPLQQTSVRGQASQWEVGAWTEGGNVPNASIQLKSTTGAGIPTFTFGCGVGDGTSACNLGAVDASSAQRLFQAQVTVPATATTVTAVSLTVTGSAANLPTVPAASASLTVQATASAASLSPMPLSSIASTSTLSPGGSAASLFPTVAPGSSERATPVANVSALSNSSIGPEAAEGAGLAALGLAVVLAITRVSIRRPTPRHAANSTTAAAPPSEAPAERQE
jgi:hypothetical protein